jgi:beta-1,4-mannosyl-glycoprotein beta-1,4-N-acetylglucosaminyltransferase
MKSKLFDCVTFFQENLQMELRFNILKEVVDKFVVCESLYDHRGREKKINFSKSNFPEVSSKIEHIIVKKKFPEKNTPWQNQSWQREFIIDGIKDATDEDYIMFSDPDEIPNPEKIKDFNLVCKYGIFLQNMYTYKLNLFNKYESPWEGTRICKKKDLKSIDWLRHSILMKNLKYSFWRVDKEKNIQIINNGGWHFNYLLNPSEISKKFKSLAETSWDKEEFYNEENIKKKIDQKKDLFNRGHKFDVVKIDESYPDYLKKNIDKYRKWII